MKWWTDHWNGEEVEKIDRFTEERTRVAAELEPWHPWSDRCTVGGRTKEQAPADREAY